MDPFSQVDDVSGLSHRLEDLVRAMSMRTKPSLKHIYALLAYADQLGVREKFDERFGVGSADAIISKATQNDAVTSLKSAVDVLNKQVSELPALASRLDAISAAVQAVAAPDFAPLIQAVRESAAKPEVGTDSEDDDGQEIAALKALTAAVNQMIALQQETIRLQRAKRVILKDINDNVTGMKLED